jgi:hypothetical protein
MKIHHHLTINGKSYRKGDSIPWVIYPFFLIHIAIFGFPVFAGAYLPNSIVIETLIFYHILGSFAALVYVVFYEAMFGRDAVKWMFIDGALSSFGIYSVVGAWLEMIGRDINNYPLYLHILPFLFYILYTFMIRQAFLDLTKSRDDKARRRMAEGIYVGISLAIYTLPLVF